MGGVLHPFFALRFAGLPADAAQLASGETLARVDAHAREGEDVQRLSQEICRRLEARFPEIPNQASRRALLDVKRALHNLRRPKPGAWSRLAPALPQALREAGEQGIAALDRWLKSDAHIDETYAEELACERTRLRQLYDFEPFRAAIEISNPLLATRLEKLFGPHGASLSEKDSSALWLSLAAYALRAACKTSPQSSFGTVAVGRWREDARAAFPAFTNAFDSRYELRKAPLEQLLKPLLRRADALDPDAPLRLNPSLHVEGDKWRWVRIDDSERGNDRTLGAVSSAMQIDANKPLQIVLAHFQQSADAHQTVTSVRHSLEARLPAALHANIPTLLQRLLDSHIVETVPQAQQVSALEASRRSAALLDAPLRRSVQAALTELEQSLHDLAEGGRGDVRQPLRSVERAYEQLGAAADRVVRAEDFRPIVHDDCSLPEFSMAPAAIGEIVADLTRLLDLTCLLGGAAGHATTSFVAAAHFLDRYGVDGVCTEVEAFLAAVAARVGTSSAQRSGGSQKGGFAEAAGPPLVTARQLSRLSDRLADRMAELAERGEDRTLDWEFFAPLLAEVPASIARRRVSHCINGQIVPDSAGRPRFVVNQIYPGSSRMISRFLPGRPDVRAGVSSYMKEIAGGRDPVAIPGVFGFNANLHPRFLDSEFDIGPFAPDRADTHKIPIADLTLRYDPATEQLVVHHADGTPIEPVYLGILISQRLPPLHRILDCIAGTSEGVTPIWLAVARRMRGFQERITTVPRLTAGSIVIARRTYYVPKSCFPDCSASNTAFFRSVQDWRARHGVPRHIFYHRRLRDPASSLVQQKTTLDDAQRQRMRMMFKPIYADLASPICVQLMRTNLVREEEDLVFAEALPDQKDAICAVGGRSTVSELSLELTRSGQ